MKKVLAVLLAVLSIFSCFSCAAWAAEGAEEPVVSPSGFYVGKILAIGDEVRSSFGETCETLLVTYTVGADDMEQVSSKLQKQYCAEDFYGVAAFRDNVAGFGTGDIYKGVYTIKDIGDDVGELEVENGSFKSGDEIYNSLSKDEKKAQKKAITFEIDYKYAKDTLIQYTKLTGWEILSFIDTETSIELRLKAVYETREPNGFENSLEGIYDKWCDMLDVLGDHWIKLIPEVIAGIARILGK